jgi:predicted nucleic acid-binding protein
MSDSFFVDTNLLVYAHDRGSGSRHEIAKDLVRELWETRSGIVSTQVLQELYVSLRRKAERPLGLAAARRLIEDYRSWKVVINDGAAVLRAIDLEKRYSVSFWDALIIDAAATADAALLLSEDLGHGQRYGTIEVRDPFA